jgi:hypothetical protein
MGEEFGDCRGGIACLQAIDSSRHSDHTEPHCPKSNFL